MNENRKIAVELTAWQWEMVRFIIEEDSVNTQIAIDQAKYEAELARRAGDEYKAKAREMVAEREAKNKSDAQEVLNEIEAQINGK